MPWSVSLDVIEMAQNKLLILVLLPLLGLLGACATPEYLANEAQCEPKALRQYPPEYESRWVTRSYQEYVHDGGYRCVNEGRYKTCRPTLVPVQVYRNTLEDYDINQGARDTLIRACTRQRCVEQMGNPECKVPQR